VTDHIVVGDRVLLDISFRAAQARLRILARDGVLLRASEEAYGEDITGPMQLAGPAAGLTRLPGVGLENLAEMETSNLPLGVKAGAVYEQAQIRLSPGDRIVTFTDGLLDAEDSHGEPFGDRRLGEVLNGEDAASVAGLKFAILNHLLDFTGGSPLEDDLTILTAEIR